METPSFNEYSIRTVNVASTRPISINHFEFAPAMGAATIDLDATVDGKPVHVFPKRDLREFAAMFSKDSNAPFKQFNVPLFPLSNRLLPDSGSSAAQFTLGQDFVSEIEHIPVKMLFNHVGRSPNAIPHHLHGLAYAQSSVDVNFTKLNDGVRATTSFQDFFRGYWTGRADLDVIQSIQDGKFHYELIAKNTGSTPVPVAFGSHPYFQIPSGNPRSVILSIPSGRIAEIDNLDNVLPNGTMACVTEGDHPLNFTQGKNLPTGVIDNYFVLDQEQRSVQLIDQEARLKFIMTALTDNIIGVQVYYPGQGSVIAIEMVTNLPDPRVELWKAIPSGMKVLEPGESARYEYQISVESC